eukprot:jgi/Ulvmu1/4022/UM189_0006.1
MQRLALQALRAFRQSRPSVPHAAAVQDSLQQLKTTNGLHEQFRQSQFLVTYSRNTLTRAYHQSPSGVLAPRQLSRSTSSNTALNMFRRMSSTNRALLCQPVGEIATSKAGDIIARGLAPGSRTAMAAWLGVCTGWVFSLIVLGGVTRLTRSGLSMTDWKFTGERPPVTAEDWDREFAKYRASPEFQRVNSRMTLDEFKFIYWMEYVHRMWGRALGLVFALPALYFAGRGHIRGALAGRLGLLFLMGGAQGFVGWWMVKSGLQQPESQHDVPRVSPYRLAAHLTSAFAIYCTLLWTTLSLAAPTAPSMTASLAETNAAALLRGRALPLAALIGLTAISGAFVAGNDAGHAYNTFPLMHGSLVPPEYFSPDTPGWRNVFENTAAVQLHHRALALTTLASVAAFYASARPLALPRGARALVTALPLLAAAQVTLGVTTLLTYVPVELGSAHQAGALVLMSVAVALLHALRRQPHAAAAYGWVTPAAAATVSAVAGAAIYSA